MLLKAVRRPQVTSADARRGPSHGIASIAGRIRLAIGGGTGADLDHCSLREQPKASAFAGTKQPATPS
eukprot:2408802-Pyramimonas_sp.AAC.1